MHVKHKILNYPYDENFPLCHYVLMYMTVSVKEFKATPHSSQNKKDCIIKDMNKQKTLSCLSDELAQTKTSKKAFLKQMEQIIPWNE